MSTVNTRDRQSRVIGIPTFPRHIVFVLGFSALRHRRTQKGDLVPVMNYEVTKKADMTDNREKISTACFKLRFSNFLRSYYRRIASKITSPH